MEWPVDGLFNGRQGVQGGHRHTNAISFYNLNNEKVSPNWLLGI